MTTLNIRIDEKVKASARKTFASIGLDMSSAVKLFLHQTALQKKLPFQVLTANGYTPEFEAEIKKDIEETMADLKSGKIKKYSSVEQLHRDILK
ncbi:hypothetical protein A3C57_01450 [Candidatus Nomurabacteria bacterium RIFCSPHIGHO2_02_FULL_33_12]|nr:MAG: hypothetical protein A3C57_01450 [Candidatus Nomurabacteria bacterium RIFCSPHIGHO2_02_FULL_33_12]